MIANNARKTAERIATLTETHHLVRDYVVLEIARSGVPLSPESIAERLKLPLDRVAPVLDELEVGMTFLFRNPAGEVEWAYPVTAARTRHQITFGDGKQIWGA
jgi:hypothetical protein